MLYSTWWIAFYEIYHFLSLQYRNIVKRASLYIMYVSYYAIWMSGCDRGDSGSVLRVMHLLDGRARQRKRGRETESISLSLSEDELW